MLRIIDARTGESVAAAPARRGLTRVQVHAPGHGPDALRVLLVADLLVRALELGGTPVLALLTGGGDQRELRTAGTALGIRPFEEGRDPAAGTGAAARALHVVAEDGETPDGVRIAVAPVRPAPADVLPPDLLGPSGDGLSGDGPSREEPSAVGPPGDGLSGVGPSRDEPPSVGPPGHEPSAVGPPGHEPPSVGPSGSARPGTDPAAVRLALLSHHHRRPAPLDADALRAAHDTLARWRRAVADWARQPSRPVPDEVRGRLRAAWEDDLDVPEVLRVLRSVEQAGTDLPPGARFETYAYADRLLGLDLTRDLGAPA
ncbi:hypothetical protein [Streptomyces sp. NPDC059894]|uniref:hypothetical protein n=1 Tax=unclassified Streptomyces TaxID=2593676 RepID=UPI00365DE4FB